jgi:2-keto-3-deoxy-L-rhamnonate aldolase RhmA
MTTALRERLSFGPCFGTFVKLPRPEIADVLSLVGFDFAICDLEHAQMSEDEARTLIRACVSNDLPVVVRLPEPTPGVVNRLLEAGAQGIQMPRLRTGDETRALYDMTHFPPRGRRSVGNANRQAAYGKVSTADYVRDADQDLLVIGQFETREDQWLFDEVMDKLDVAFIGPTDLSVDYGVPGKSDDPDVAQHVSQVHGAADRRGIIMGVFVGDAEGAKRYVEAGYRFFAVGSDVSLFVNEARRVGEQLQALHGVAHA